MSTFAKRLAAPKSIESVMELAVVEATRIRNQSRNQQKSISEIGCELLELLSVDPASLAPYECGEHACKITTRQREFVRVVAALLQPELLISQGLAIPQSKPFLVEEITGALIGTEGPYQWRYDQWEKEEKAEKERQSRIHAFAEEEAFEKSLRARQRAGEIVDLEKERRLHHQAQTPETTIHDYLPT